MRLREEEEKRLREEEEERLRQEEEDIEEDPQKDEDVLKEGLEKEDDVPKEAVVTKESTQPKSKEITMDEDNEDWELELNQMADNSKSTSVQDLLSFLESNQDNASSKSKARAEKQQRKKKKKVPPQVQKEVHDLLSGMIAKKRQRKLSLKNIAKDLIEDRRRSATHERTPLEMAVDAKRLDAKKQRAVSVSNQRPRSRKPRRANTHHFG